MNREMEYYEQFGSMSCSEPEDTPGISDADERGGIDAENGNFSAPEDTPGISDGETAGAAAS